MANPIHIPAVFSAGGIKNQIQKTLQSGQDPQDATWVNGWGGITMVPIEDGGKAPKGQDFNGVLNAICDHTVFNQNGGRYQWSQLIIDNYGGYPKDAIIQSDDGLREYRSLVNSNTTNPNNGIGLTWLVYSGDGSLPIASSTTAGITKVVNALNSTDVTSALSAAQGKILQDQKVAISSIVNNLNSTITNVPLSAAQGKVLNDKFDFVNSKTTSGNVSLGDSGLILQWGEITSGGSVLFSKAFTTACLSLSFGMSVTGRTRADNIFYSNLSRTGFSTTGLTPDGSSTSIIAKYFAIGY